MNTLERLKELQAAATPGPWDRLGLYNVLRIARKSLDWELVHPTPDTLFPDEEDAVFIALAINVLPALISVAEAAGYLVFAEKRQGFELDLADWARAKDNLKAALAKLEGEV